MSSCRPEHLRVEALTPLPSLREMPGGFPGEQVPDAIADRSDEPVDLRGPIVERLDNDVTRPEVAAGVRAPRGPEQDALRDVLGEEPIGYVAGE